MADGEDPLAPPSVAEAIAPIIDRLRLVFARQVPAAAGDLLEAYGLDPVRRQVVGMLRNLLGDRTTTRSHVCAAFRYWPDGQVDAALDRLLADGLLRGSDHDIGLSDPGRELLGALRTRIEAFVDELWSAHTGSLDELADLAGRAVSAARATGGPSYALVAPVYEPEGTSDAMLLAERLTPLRFHRADAHAAAWRAAGLTAQEVQQLGPGPPRDAIEAETNRVAGQPYDALTPAERFALVAGLGRLPG